MDSYRFTTREQRNANLAILRDLLIDNVDDQPARTALTNAITMAESTMVAGELDELIERTNRMQRNSNIVLSVFFVILAVAEFVFAYMMGWTMSAFPPAMFGLCALVYTGALWGLYRIQRRYYTALKWLETMQLELPTIPHSLIAVQ